VPELTRWRPELMLGVDPTTARTESVITVDRGATVLLYTDGLIERRDRGLDEGLDTLSRAVTDVHGRPLDEAVQELTASMLLGEEGSDDVCALLLSWAG